MDEPTREEIGILYARIEYLRVAVNILLSRLSADEFLAVSLELAKHFAEHQGAALSSTFPDSYLRECEKYPPSQLADADQKRQRRAPRRDPKTG